MAPFTCSQLIYLFTFLPFDGCSRLLFTYCWLPLPFHNALCLVMAPLTFLWLSLPLDGSLYLFMGSFTFGSFSLLMAFFTCWWLSLPLMTLVNCACRSWPSHGSLYFKMGLVTCWRLAAQVNNMVKMRLVSGISSKQETKKSTANKKGGEGGKRFLCRRQLLKGLWSNKIFLIKLIIEQLEKGLQS